MNLCISYWYGRLGNNIIQVINALQIAIDHDYNIILPPHEYFNTTYIVLNNNIRKEMSIYNRSEFYFQDRYSSKYFDKTNKSKHDRIHKIIKTIFKYPPGIIPKNRAVIHIRSGDIFSNCPPSEYIMPPLSYYCSILESETFKKLNHEEIYVIAEDEKNPCILSLLNLYPNIKFKIQALSDDIKLLLECSTIIESFGTFTIALEVMSNNIKNVYRPSYQMENIVSLGSNKITIHTINLSEYHRIMGKWRNTEEQRAIMINYMR